MNEALWCYRRPMAYGTTYGNMLAWYWSTYHFYNCSGQNKMQEWPFPLNYESYRNTKQLQLFFLHIVHFNVKIASLFLPLVHPLKHSLTCTGRRWGAGDHWVTWSLMSLSCPIMHLSFQTAPAVFGLLCPKGYLALLLVEGMRHRASCTETDHSIMSAGSQSALMCRVTGAQLLTTQELRDMAKRCWLLWNVRTLCGGDMAQQIDLPEALVEFLLFRAERCWKQAAKRHFLEFD